jgi:hypothetical protein
VKYVVSWKPRVGGSVAENEAGIIRVLKTTSRWTPSPGTTIHQFVVRIDGEGGFAVVETDNPADIAATIFKFAAVLEPMVYPVIDLDEALQAARSRQT